MVCKSLAIGVIGWFGVSDEKSIVNPLLEILGTAIVDRWSGVLNTRQFNFWAVHFEKALRAQFRHGGGFVASHDVVGRTYNIVHHVRGRDIAPEWEHNSTCHDVSKVRLNLLFQFQVKECERGLSFLRAVMTCYLRI